MYSIKLIYKFNASTDKIAMAGEFCDSVIISIVFPEFSINK